MSAYRRWKYYDVKYVNDVFNEKGQILQFNEFVEKFHVPTNFMQYYEVLNRFLRKLVRRMKENNLHSDSAHQDALVEKVISSFQMKLIYSLLVSSRKCQRELKIEKWSYELGEPFSLTEVFSLPNVCCVESQMRNVHFRLISKILPTNAYSNKIKILTADLCTFCSNASE